MESNTKYTLENRRYVIGGAVILLVLIFIVRLFFLQIIDSDYKAWADSNAFLKKTLYPSRGIMYDRNGKMLVYNQPAYDVMFIMREIQPFDTLDFCNILGITKQQFVKRMADVKDRRLNPGYSSYVPQVFMNQLSARECGVLQEKLYKFPGFYIQNRTIREYEYPYAAHVLGTIGEVNRKDIENDDYYVQGDNSGRSGIEQSYESVLRGTKGVEILLRDAHGRIKGRYEEGKFDVAPVSGKNLTLSIDMELQELGERLMQNKRGSIVMIEPETGEILCMVSTPSYDPGMLSGRQRGKNHKLLERNPDKPLLNRAIMGLYPPGSTFKPTQALTFLQEGVITKETQYTCAHGYTFRGGKPACHGHASPLNLTYALATSCNSYFCWGLHDMIDSRKRYSTVQEAFEVWKNYLISMGYGYKLGVDLPGEKRGFVPNSKYYDKYYRGRWNSSTIISIAIGQGEILATPLQICNLAATIANRGHFITPHVVKEIQDTPLDTLYTNKRYTMIERKNYEIVAEGMRNAVLGGTCTRAAIPGIEVCGKTGTAENPHGKDHSAFIGFAPYQNPKVAICVYVENGGFGATYGVPIGKLMMEKYLTGTISEADKLLEETMANAVVSPNILSLPDREL
ncbi:penicillin-binding protein 2 [Parabacteroides chinchillae]|uniref:Penicillin-binding protein 2 n=1 Tax=Parabacteroides chinchillae TaxID=871327 RepID=A0A8G2BXK1_9BACT|nr:penicillin-binding protein 2 [Parabacteroides chinchillae]SEG04834.1 penicillin-binding protein 2 [Parabacteroides chinchillae]